VTEIARPACTTVRYRGCQQLPGSGSWPLAAARWADKCVWHCGQLK